jgi:hypothetical protein
MTEPRSETVRDENMTMIATEPVESGTLRGTEWKDVDNSVEVLRRNVHARTVETVEQLQSRVSDLAEHYNCNEQHVRAILREQLTTHYWRFDLDRIKTPAMTQAYKP